MLAYLTRLFGARGADPVSAAASEDAEPVRLNRIPRTYPPRTYRSGGNIPALIDCGASRAESRRGDTEISPQPLK